MPTVAVAGPLFDIVRSGTGAALTDVLTGGLVLLPGVLSPPPETVAVFDTGPMAVGVTVIVATWMFIAPLAIGALVVQVTVCPFAPHEKPALAVTVPIERAAAIWSVTVTVP